MGEYKGTPGELIYEYTVQFAQVVEYGISANAVFSGQMQPPAEGARFDVYFEGPITGPKMKGTVKGVDYLHIRADGRCQLNIHAEITTEDGKEDRASRRRRGDSRGRVDGLSASGERDADNQPPGVLVAEPDPSLGPRDG